MEQGKVIRRAEIPVTAGKPSREQQKRWINEQVPYRNFAGVSDNLDMMVATQVLSDREQFRNRMQAAMESWATNWSAANGQSVWQEHEDDLHVPETKKAVDGKAARVEEALFDFDPIFEVEGVRGDLPRWRAQLIAAYTRRQMEVARYRDLVQPTAKDSDICNLAAIKVAYEQQEELIVEKKSELRSRPDGTEYYFTESRMRRAIAKKGVVYRQCDPFWFFFDIDAADVDDCGYIGDESIMFDHDALQKGKDGFFDLKSVKKALATSKKEKGETGNTNSDNSSRSDWPDMLRNARSIAMGTDTSGSTKGEHGVGRGRCIERWGWFDFGPDGIEGITDPLGEKLTGAHRTVSTLFRGVTVRFQLNPFNRKFAPYALARVNRNGHEMVAPAPIEQVVQVNAQYDGWWSDVQRMSRQSVAPVVVAESDSDLPDSILGIMPGTVIRNAGKWDVVKMPDPGPHVQYMQQSFRREAEEASGVLRVYESPVNTATESNRKVQEQQRMIRPAIRANGEMWRRVALLTHWISAQFATQPEKFAVVGKGASWLGKHAMMTPDILQEDVDFKFLGLSDMHTFGDRLNGQAQWMNRWGPMLQTMPDINLMALAKRDFELSVGRAGIEEIFPDASSAWDILPQEEENEMLLAGHEVGVSKLDDDLDHIKKMMKHLTNPKLPYASKMRFLEHYNQHVVQGKQKEAEQRAKMQEAQQNAMLQAPLGGKPGTERPPQQGGMPAAPQSDAQKKGVTPGPTQSRTVAKTGREGNGISQQQMSA